MQARRTHSALFALGLFAATHAAAQETGTNLTVIGPFRIIAAAGESQLLFSGSPGSQGLGPFDIGAARIVTGVVAAVERRESTFDGVAPGAIGPLGFVPNPTPYTATYVFYALTLNELNADRSGPALNPDGSPIAWTVDLGPTGHPIYWARDYRTDPDGAGRTPQLVPGTVVSLVLWPAADGRPVGALASVVVECPAGQVPPAGAHCDSVTGSTVRGEAVNPQLPLGQAAPFRGTSPGDVAVLTAVRPENGWTVNSVGGVCTASHDGDSYRVDLSVSEFARQLTVVLDRPYGEVMRLNVSIVFDSTTLRIHGEYRLSISTARNSNVPDGSISSGGLDQFPEVRNFVFVRPRAPQMLIGGIGQPGYIQIMAPDFSLALAGPLGTVDDSVLAEDLVNAAWPVLLDTGPLCGGDFGAAVVQFFAAQNRLTPDGRIIGLPGQPPTAAAPVALQAFAEPPAGSVESFLGDHDWQLNTRFPVGGWSISPAANAAQIAQNPELLRVCTYTGPGARVDTVAMAYTTGRRDLRLVFDVDGVRVAASVSYRVVPDPVSADAYQIAYSAGVSFGPNSGGLFTRVIQGIVGTTAAESEPAFAVLLAAVRAQAAAYLADPTIPALDVPGSPPILFITVGELANLAAVDLEGKRVVLLLDGTSPPTLSAGPPDAAALVAAIGPAAIYDLAVQALAYAWRADVCGP